MASGTSAANLLPSARVPALERVPGLVHGFERRPPGALASSLDESRARVAQALAPFGRLLLMKQVHGAAVRQAPWQGRPEGDAAVADRAGFLLGIETADCLPVLLVDPVRRAASAAHAGWRGSAKGVVRAAVAELVRGGSRAGDILAALGPANGACCYEVGEELRASFPEDWADITRAGPRGRPHLDVREANVRQLLRAGLRSESLHHVNDCTFCQPERYYSYRRDGAHGGRMISYVGWSA